MSNVNWTPYGKTWGELEEEFDADTVGLLVEVEQEAKLNQYLVGDVNKSLGTFGEGCEFSEKDIVTKYKRVWTKNQAPVKRRFVELPLGTRFRYCGLVDVFVVLGVRDNGKVARHLPGTDSNKFQEVLSATYSTEECYNLEVELAE